MRIVGTIFGFALIVIPSLPHEVLAQSCVGGAGKIACLEVRNDTGVSRSGEVAYSGVAIPQVLNLTGTGNLAVVDAAGQPVPAQFRPLARWGGVVDDGTRPIRWLEVAIQDDLAPQTTRLYTLRQEGSPPQPPAAALTVTPVGGNFVVDTGAATFTLDPTNPALVQGIDVGSDTVYSHVPGSGPRLVLDGGSLVLDTSLAGRVVVDPSSFTVLEQGPVKASFALDGHFVDPGGATVCAIDVDGDGAPDESFGYTVVLTLIRGTRDLDLWFEFRNECFDIFAFNAMARTVDRVSWELPLTFGASPASYYGGSGAVVADAAGRDVTVEQRKGAGNPWRRRARVTLGGGVIETPETIDVPFVGLGGAPVVASAQMPWMRFREPQGLATVGNTVSLLFVSEPLVVGAGKGVWNQARVSLTPGVTGPGDLEALRTANRLALERGLLVRSPRADTNAAQVLPSLGTSAPSLLKSEYERFLLQWHEDTVGPGGQHALAKTYGSQLWPDTQGATWPNADNPNGPSDNPGGLNYWNTSRVEVLEFLRTGDPRWAWDLALPLTWQQIISAYLNLGQNNDGFKNGYALTSPVCDFGSGLCAEGQHYRYGGGSDDYTYTFGNLGYVLRPNHSLRRRFAQAGATTLSRYDVPRAQQAQRGQHENQVDLTRQVIQHFVQLANCAEFVPGAQGQACHDHLIAIVTELSEENMASGLLCQGDLQPPEPSPCVPDGGGNPNLDWCDCVMPQQFMLNSLMIPFLTRVYLNYGDLGGNLRQALAQTPWHFYRAAMGIPPAQTPSEPSAPQRPAIPAANDWYGQPGWDTDVTPYAVQDVDVTDGDPNTPGVGTDEANRVLEPNKPHTVAQLLLAHALDPTLRLCEVSRTSLDDQFMLDAWDAYEFSGGWSKGPAQVMQGMAFGVGIFDTCSDDGNTPPVVSLTSPANGSTFASGSSVALAATATDTQDGDLSAALTWSSNLDGGLGGGAALSVVLSDGLHTLTASVTDTGGLTGAAAVSVTVGNVNTAPEVTITTPVPGAEVGAGASLSLSAAATDAQDGDLTAQIAWSSDRDGALGTGGTVSATLSPGAHTLTASVVDSGGAAGAATVAVTATCLTFTETFESGASGWTTSGLWHRTVASACATPGYSSPTSAMYFGQDASCTYETGTAVTGDLVSPLVSGLVPTSELRFDFLRQVEEESSDSYDRTEVAVSVDGNQWTTVWSMDSTQPSQAGWSTSPSISLSAWAGQSLRIRFRFASVDEQANDFLGFMVDDVRVTGLCALASFFADGFESGSVSAWSAAVGGSP